MNTKPLGWLVIFGLIYANALTAQPLEDLQARLAALRSEKPIRVKVDVEIRHRESAPLHLDRTKQKGRVTVRYDARGPRVGWQRSSKSGSHVSLWKNADGEDYAPLVTEEEAGDLVDPAGMLALLLEQGTLVSDEEVTWEGQPARLLVIRPLPFGTDRDDDDRRERESERFTTEAKIWLDADGAPLALERSMELRLGPALQATQLQTLTFQQVHGRLLAARSEETFSGTALAVLRDRGEKRMKVTVD